jgi:urease accessory protein
MRGTFRAALAALLVLAAGGAARAHTGHDVAFGFASGFLHPLGGLDHLLAMAAVGLLAAQIGGRALWLVPGTFVSIMLLGALVGLAGVALPATEHAILFSIFAISLPVALALRLPTTFAMPLVALFAVFHGHAHAIEMPVAAFATSYMAGFALATALIHAGGLALGLLLLARQPMRPVLRLAGGAIALAGCVLALG